MVFGTKSKFHSLRKAMGARVILEEKAKNGLKETFNSHTIKLSNTIYILYIFCYLKSGKMISKMVKTP